MEDWEVRERKMVSISCLSQWGVGETDPQLFQSSGFFFNLFFFFDLKKYCIYYDNGDSPQCVGGQILCVSLTSL